MGKRKRDGEAREAEVPAIKKQATASNAATSAAERRQKRSERKSKKDQSAKDNAKSRRKHVSEELKESQPEIVTDNDGFAEGQDFVSLNDSVDPVSEPSAKSGRNGHASVIPSDQDVKTQKASPRPERKKSKKENKGKTVVDGHGSAAVSDPSTNHNADSNGKNQSNSSTRFICFVGNLPYSCTTDQLKQHFRKLSPTSVRHSTDKNSGKSKGFAFLEFDDYSKMKTCLKVYHHSTFDPERTSKLPDEAFDENGLEIMKPGQETKSRGRKINVELTAGGGGKGSERKDKIQKKNTKLFEERERRKVAEVKEQKTKYNKRREERSDANATEIGSEAVHPSRMRRVPNEE